ncbi:YbhB/YbcL family Raf kinase inhibitor-like protein [Psychromicrobium lacuslunae]|uniref:PEBP family protein n=1 Tax=Psychromicrobium lacuslunae TaxID=1618207 RepID=A0A0D4BZA9_9MICC|nr:YbhB/YbcL family Raf kinase inhibitor-like protein [Psychromicrobium lacuslunae]AJT41456.1 hypothetical protein UM93_07880 [Psychromicrobium lacuslunae]
MLEHLLGRLLKNVHSSEAKSCWYAPELAAPQTLQLSSTAFDDEGDIPLLHSGKGRGDNLSPALAWSDPPEETKQFLFILEDVDVPMPRPILHTVALISASRLGLEQGELSRESADIRFLPAAFGSRGYRGPRPLPQHGPHRYRFQLFALDRELGTDTPKFAKLLGKLDGRVLARGLYTGVQEQR